MEIRTFTNFWNIEKKIYSIYDIQLPVAVSLRAVGVFAGTGVPYWIILNLFGIQIGLSTFLIFLAPPVVFAIIGNKPIFEGKSLVDYLQSRIKFLFESRKYKGLRPSTEKYKTITTVEDSFYSINN